MRVHVWSLSGLHVWCPYLLINLTPSCLIGLEVDPNAGEDARTHASPHVGVLSFIGTFLLGREHLRSTPNDKILVKIAQALVPHAPPKTVREA